MSRNYIFSCGTQLNSAVIYDRGTLKAMGGLTELKNAVTNIDNDGIGEMPTLMAASENRLFIIKRKVYGLLRTKQHHRH